MTAAIAHASGTVTWATPDLDASVIRHTPAGRWGASDDAARLIAWLASDEARWITGQVINSEGGFCRYGS